MDAVERARVLDQYRRAKRAQLADDGPAALAAELFRLEEFLERVDGGQRPEDFSREVEVDVAWRRAKAEVLRALLKPRT
ncbi:MAG TPA: hypothetical protein VI997_00115 [Candidatus Thermoplasmatota archaeon]|nr:hypothetical protein [Candidatus Thermoplasmatota archaeon]